MYKVFGYDMGCEDFEFVTDSFVEAVKAFKKISAGPDVVFISGVCEKVEDRLMYGL